MFNISDIRNHSLIELEKKLYQRELNKNKFLKNLFESHNLLVYYLTDLIQDKVKHFILKKPNGTSFRIFNPGKEYYDKNNFKVTTLMKGFWNYRKRIHERSVHEQAGIYNDPIHDVNALLNNSGIFIKDITNPKKSHNSVYQIILIDNKECVICKDNFTNFHDIYVTQCFHVYHETCLIKWNQFSSTTRTKCPLCRTDISNIFNNNSTNNNPTSSTGFTSSTEFEFASATGFSGPGFISRVGQFNWSFLG